MNNQIKNYQICSKCVMDTSDPDIKFDINGVCNHCHSYDSAIKFFVHSGEEGIKKLLPIIEEIKNQGKHNKYDCVIGVSGGVDSTYTAYKVKYYGLRPLAVHLDNGWNSELSVQNIKLVLNKLNIDLYTHVIDWNEFRNLQTAFLKASTPDSEIPSDHAIFSLMYQIASKYKIKYIITGLNRRTESHLPDAWSRGHYDWLYIKSIHKKFSTGKLKTFPYMNFLKYRFYMRNIKKLDILDYIDYVKKDAMNFLETNLGWRYYGGKHYESIYTRFYQGYILPKKFGFDKRKSHLSSLICSNEITRNEALCELKKETYPEEMRMHDKEYVIKKMGLTETEFENIMNLPKKSFWDYSSYEKFYLTEFYKKFSKAGRFYDKIKQTISAV